MKKKWSLSFLTLANVILIYLIVCQYQDRIDLNRLLQGFVHIPTHLIIATAALNLGLILLYGCRLSRLIDEPLQVGFGIAAVGYAANNILPLRLGELTRIYFAQKKYHIPTSRSLLAMMCERASDLFSIACLGLIALFMAANQLPVSQTLIMIGLITPLTLLFLFQLFERCPLKQKVQQYRLYARYIQPILSELQNLFSLKKVAELFGFTLLIWLVTLCMFFIFLQNSFFQVHISLLDTICLTVCTSLSLAISTLPSNIGLFEAGIVYYLHTVRQADETSALTLAFALHALILVPQLLCMSYFLISKYTATTKPIETTNLLEQS